MTATGRWVDAERELRIGLRITEGACPALHRLALTRLAALRIRQGRLEDAGELLSAAGAGAAIDVDASLLLARGDGVAASSPARATGARRPSSRPGRGAGPARRG